MCLLTAFLLKFLILLYTIYIFLLSRIARLFSFFFCQKGNEMRTLSRRDQVNAAAVCLTQTGLNGTMMLCKYSKDEPVATTGVGPEPCHVWMQGWTMNVLHETEVLPLFSSLAPCLYKILSVGPEENDVFWTLREANLGTYSINKLIITSYGFYCVCLSSFLKSQPNSVLQTLATPS